jgi:hypothetical protein
MKNDLIESSRGGGNYVFGLRKTVHSQKIHWELSTKRSGELLRVKKESGATL